MPGKCTHEENRRKVCAICGRKICFKNKNPDSFMITDSRKVNS